MDDCSHDETFKILNELAQGDKRIKVFQTPENSGAAIARNKGLTESTGDYIAFLDCDDLWAASKLAKQAEFMQTSALHFSYHNYLIINRKGERIKEMNIENCYVAQELLRFNPFATSSIMISRKIADSVRFREHMRRRQDYLFWFEALTLANHGKGLSEQLSSYRLSGDDSLSANKRLMAKIQWQLLKDEFGLSPIARIYYFVQYAIHGVKKYFL